MNPTMKKALFLFLLFFNTHLNAQHNYDLTWALGLGNTQGDTAIKGVNLVFEKDGVKTYSVKRDIRISKFNTTGNDKNGNLQFYFNGCFVYNRFDTLMKNGAGLMLGSMVLDPWCAEDKYLPGGNNSSMVIPISDSIYYLIYQKTDYVDNYGIVAKYLMYAKINMNKNKGQGEVLEKQKVIIADLLDIGHLTAVKKANGKGWWIIQPRIDSGEYYFVSLSESGVFKIELKTFNIPDAERNNGSGTAVISPDGKKYARRDKEFGIYLMDLDREKGTLSNFKTLHTDTILPSFITSGSVCFSPDSRFLYASDLCFLNQFDTEAADVQASRVLIAERTKVPYNLFKYMILGADCKIYITTDGNGYYHIIDQPNEKGMASNFLMRGLKQPIVLPDAAPYFPNHRLDTPDEHRCDSLKKVNNREAPPEPLLTCAVYPNPVQDQVNIDLYGYVQQYQQGTWRLFDVTGKAVASFSILQGHDEYNYDISFLPKGLYLWQLDIDNRVRSTGKLLKIE